MNNIGLSILNELDARTAIKITLTLDIDFEAAGEFPGDAEASVRDNARDSRITALGE